MTAQTTDLLYVTGTEVDADSIRDRLERAYDYLTVKAVSDLTRASEARARAEFDVIVCERGPVDGDALTFLEDCDDAFTALVTAEFTPDGMDQLRERNIDTVIPADSAAGADLLVYHARSGRVDAELASGMDTAGDGSETLDVEAHLVSLASTTTDAIVTIDDESVVQFANPALADILGYEPDAVIGEPLTMLMRDEIAEQHLAGLSSYLETGDRNLDWENVSVPGQHADGYDVPLTVSFSEFTSNGDRYFTGIVRDATVQKRREERLRKLTETSRSLMNATTRREVADIVVESIDEILDLPATVVRFYDEGDGTFGDAVSTDRADDLATGDGLFSAASDRVWSAFTSGETKVFDDLTAEGGAGAVTQLPGSGLVVPIGGFGVLVSGHPEQEAFDEEQVALTEILATNARVAIEQVDREQELEAHRQTLAERAETLERVNRVNDVIRKLTRALTNASDRMGIYESVCGNLANTDPNVFAWIGEPDPTAEGLTPKTSAGVNRDYLDALVADDEDVFADSPSARAARTREVQMENNLHSNPPFEPWRSEAIQRDFRSCLAIPLTYTDSLFGVLTVFSDTPEAFDDMLASVLAELGEMVGYAINALERKKALVSDRTVALEFDIRDQAIPAVQFVGKYGGRFELETVVEEADGTMRALFEVSGVEPEELRESVEQAPTVSDLQLISEREDGYLFEATITADDFLGVLLSQGAQPTNVVVTESEARLTVELPQSGDIRSFIDGFVNRYEGVELVARRELDRPVKTEEQFQAVYRQRLTDRQEEVIQTAFYAGFFDWPREATGQDVADVLDISQPTVARHIRTGERKLFELLFDRDATRSAAPPE